MTNDRLKEKLRSSGKGATDPLVMKYNKPIGIAAAKKKDLLTLQENVDS